jgi:hypothetical protein
MKIMNEEKQQKEVEQARKRIADDENVSDMFTERRNKLNKKLMDKFIKPANKEGNKQ